MCTDRALHKYRHITIHSERRSCRESILTRSTWTCAEAGPALISSTRVPSRGYSTQCWWQTPGDDTWTPAEEEGCCWPAADTAAALETPPLDSVGGGTCIAKVYAQLQHNNINHISVITYCFSSLGVQKDQNKAVCKLLVQNSLKQDTNIDWTFLNRDSSFHSSSWCYTLKAPFSSVTGQMLKYWQDELNSSKGSGIFPIHSSLKFFFYSQLQCFSKHKQGSVQDNSNTVYCRVGYYCW